MRFIFPFRWQLTYVPLLPMTLLELVEAPGTFVMGCHSKHWQFSNNEVIITTRIVFKDLFQTGGLVYYFTDSLGTRLLLYTHLWNSLLLYRLTGGLVLYRLTGDSVTTLHSLVE